MQQLLEMVDLVKSYSRRRVVDKVSVNVGPSEIVGLLGPNGAGKTTSFRMAVGMIRPEQGEVMFEGKKVTRMPMYKRARLGLGYLSQEPSIFHRLTVRDNVMAILQLIPGLSRKERKQRLTELIEELGLTHVAGSTAQYLSGGEKRRLEISRALARRPKVMMLDEPFSGIDPIAVGEIQDIITQLKDTHQLGILLTDHNVRETLSITDRSYVIHQGKVVAHGPPAELIENPLVRQIYLGDNFKM